MAVNSQLTSKLSIYRARGQAVIYHFGMKTLVPYIESVKSLLNLKTYPETMEYLGMQKQAWTNIQKGSGVAEKNAIRIAQILNIDPIEILAVSMALKAKNKESRDLWLKLAKNLENQRIKEKNDK
ncbi:hypothetical protein [Cellvibrio sp. KY-GH-1]|uniref:hypothetical protein n=1 Tax=Cellvibrio sp. KY-GH-1 TaxID=2303332 RepID=UPI001243F521|nr:hypothetical protein [Cellvibrio sp. KY-GH-1]